MPCFEIDTQLRDCFEIEIGSLSGISFDKDSLQVYDSLYDIDDWPEEYDPAYLTKRDQPGTNWSADYAQSSKDCTSVGSRGENGFEFFTCEQVTVHVYRDFKTSEPEHDLQLEKDSLGVQASCRVTHAYWDEERSGYAILEKWSSEQEVQLVSQPYLDAHPDTVPLRAVTNGLGTNPTTSEQEIESSEQPITS